MSVELDFSILDKITPDTVTEEHKSGKVYYKLEAEEKQKAELEKAAAKHLEVYAAHQDAIRKSGQLANDILMGTQAGQPPLNLLLKAVECISLITGDKLFYELNKDNIKNMYGIDISENPPGMENISPEELDEFLNN